ncbi:hypothetical protein LZV35_18275 [Acinetobacter nosocomialis]|nr:hypothetical protein [Acinetobacter nosocomialis]
MAMLEPTAFAYALILSLACLMLVLGFFYVNARVVFMVFAALVARLMLVIFLADLNPDMNAQFAWIDPITQWIDIILGVLFSLLVFIGVINGGSVTGLSVYEMLQQRKNKKEKAK